MQVFRLPGEGGSGDAALIVTRDYETQLESPVEYAKAQLRPLQKQFVAFRLSAELATEVAGRVVALLDYEWTANDVVLRQRQAFVRAEACMLVLTLTARSESFAPLEDTWASVLQSLRLRDEAPREPAAPSPRS